MRATISAQIALGMTVLLSATQAEAAPSLTFFIDGDTFSQPFSITNSSTAGEFVTRFQFDVGAAGRNFNTTPPGSPVPFAPAGGTDVITGLVGPVVVPNFATVLDITFTNFNPLEIFSFFIDVDTIGGFDDTITGDELIGTTLFVDFSNGQRLIGSLQAVPGNPDASIFTATAVVPTPSVPEPTAIALFGLGVAGFGVPGLRRLRARLSA